MSHQVISPRQFGEFTLNFHPADEDTPRHRVIAEHPQGRGGYAGALSWHPKTHEVTNIHVDESFQRKGLATAMWEMGQASRPAPKHSADRTDAGEAWSKAVGGRRPRRRPVARNPFMRSE